MTRKLLTDLGIKAMKPAPAGKRPIIWDTMVPHMGVRITDKGAKTFVVIRRLAKGDEHPLRVTIGPFSEYAEPGGQGSLAWARVRAKEALEAITQGKHPKELEDERRREEQRRRKDTFGGVADEFIKRHVATLRSARATEALIRREVLGQEPRVERGRVMEWRPGRDAVWRGRPISSITRRDVVELVEKISDLSPAQARKVLAALSRLFAWAITRDTYGLEASPCAAVKATNLIGKSVARDRVLSDEELWLVWRTAKRMGKPFGHLVRVLLLTGQRLREISDAQWHEIDTATLTVPADRMKGKQAHSVPLTATALRLLTEMPRFEYGDFIFSTTAGKRPISGFSKATGSLRRRIDRTAKALSKRDGKRRKVRHFTLHDLRRTARTRLSGLGVLPMVAELVIGHRQSGIHAVYDLHRYDAEKRAALEQWEKRLLEIVGDAPPAEAKVVPISRRRVRR